MRFAADENLDGRIFTGLLRRIPTLDIIRIQDSPLYQLSDPELLDQLANENRILITHDKNTMPGFVYERVNTGRPVPGIIEVHHTTPIGQAIDELEILISAGNPADFENQVRYIPLR
jgi:hypothetical protein